MAETAWCGVDGAPLRAEPRDDAKQVTQALRSEPPRIEERRGGWAGVVTAYEYPGWVEETALAGEPGDWLPAVRGGDPVAEARSYLGAPYLWGGMTREGIDCSGLVHMSFRALGRIVPRDADQQEEAGEEIGEPRPGEA